MGTMASRVNPPRQYRSDLRAEQAQGTRQRIVDTPRNLFIERGYTATPISPVPAAGVSDMTVYSAFRDKRGLFEAVLDAAVAGPNYVPDTPAFEAITELPTPRQRLRAWIEVTSAILTRTSPIHSVIRGAADKEP